MEEYCGYVCAKEEEYANAEWMEVRERGEGGRGGYARDFLAGLNEMARGDVQQEGYIMLPKAMLRTRELAN